MPLDNGTLYGKTGTDLTHLLDFTPPEQRNFFLDTYTYYLIGLVLAGKAIYSGHELVTLCFRGNPVENGLTLEQVENRMTKMMKEECADILMQLYMAARQAVTNFIDELRGTPGAKEALIAKRRDPQANYTVRKTLQIAFWKEVSQKCFGKFLGYKRTGNAYLLFIPSAGINNEIIQDNIREDGSVELSEDGDVAHRWRTAEPEEKPLRHYDPEAIANVQRARDSWDIRKYRIFLVKTVGDVIQRPGITPLEAYAVYYDLCDREPLLKWLGDPEIRQRYRQTERWSDQMIEDLFRQRPGLTEQARARISRRNISNYRKEYAGKLIEWLRGNVPGLDASTAEKLVTSVKPRLENLAFSILSTHTGGELGQDREQAKAILAKAMDRLSEEKTLRLEQ